MKLKGKKVVENKKCESKGTIITAEGSEVYM